jgi:hypothetical protein
MTWETYGQDLDRRIKTLHERVQAGTYRALPSRPPGRLIGIAVPLHVGRTAYHGCADLDLSIRRIDSFGPTAAELDDGTINSARIAGFTRLGYQNAQDATAATARSSADIT